MAKQDDYTRYTIRVPADLYQRVQDAADREGRSVNAEIVATLEEKYPPSNSALDLMKSFVTILASASPDGRRETLSNLLIIFKETANETGDIMGYDRFEAQLLRLTEAIEAREENVGRPMSPKELQAILSIVEKDLEKKR